MLSSASRILLWILALLYGILGIILFVAPGWSAANFSWKISPFVAITMGGWCLGNAYTAWETARLNQWRLVYANLLYLWVFGILEVLVLVLFRDRLILNVPMAWPYLLALTLNVVFAVRITYEWVRRRPELGAEGRPISALVRVLAATFILFVGFLAAYGWFSGLDGHGTDASIFPEPLTLFTLRAFASFYAALAASVVPMLWVKGDAGMIVLGRAGMSFIVFITIAALLSLNIFDFRAHPGQLLYLGAYIFAFFVVGWLLIREQQSHQAAPS